MMYMVGECLSILDWYGGWVMYMMDVVLVYS